MTSKNQLRVEILLIVVGYIAMAAIVFALSGLVWRVVKGWIV